MCVCGCVYIWGCNRKINPPNINYLERFGKEIKIKGLKKKKKPAQCEVKVATEDQRNSRLDVKFQQEKKWEVFLCSRTVL